MSGAPRNSPCPTDTIRFTVEVEVPFDNGVLNDGNKSRKIIRDFINSKEFGSYYTVSGPRSVGVAGSTSE